VNGKLEMLSKYSADFKACPNRTTNIITLKFGRQWLKLGPLGTYLITLSQDYP
jgi:hypothetical protein